MLLQKYFQLFCLVVLIASLYLSLALLNAAQCEFNLALTPLACRLLFLRLSRFGYYSIRKLEVFTP